MPYKSITIKFLARKKESKGRKIMDRSESRRNFELVHGAGHGAWCWYKVATLLRSAGHRVTALDMAASRIHPNQLNELRSLTDYFQLLMEFMESLLADDS